MGHSVTGMLRIPVLSNVTCNVEHIFYNQKVSLPKAEPLKYVFYANDSILVTKLHVRVPSYPKGGGKLYRRLKFSNCATKECDESNATRSVALPNFRRKFQTPAKDFGAFGRTRSATK